MMEKTITTYKLYGEIEVTGWHGHKGYAKIIITTDKKGLKKIRENPRKDFIGYGVQSVDRAEFAVFKRVEKYEKDKTITIDYKNAIEIIEDGVSTIPHIRELLLTSDYIFINEVEE